MKYKLDNKDIDYKSTRLDNEIITLRNELDKNKKMIFDNLKRKKEFNNECAH